MEIPGKKIASYFEKVLKKEIRRSKKKLKLCTFLVSNAPDQLSFVKIKRRVAHQLGIGFDLIHLKEIPSFEEFMHKIKEKSLDPAVTGIIIQQPLPAQISTSSIYDYIPEKKEIEGHKNKSPFTPPIGLATLTVFKYAFDKNKISDDLFVDPKKDRLIFKRAFRNKRIILLGRGITGGQPIGKTLRDYKINYIGLNSQTPDQQTYLKEADVIITAVGRKIIHAADLTPGVTLVNVGLRREHGRLKGDYDENEIKDIASAYTPTPGGIGPLDIFYLFKNLLDASKLH
ncbi:bifunctional 5,10-methylenetetrahydrofolate dehydrogenase/5,10-methenyltetrahydrofolate cyclohydrolase [Candidatus Roizmanbacteria bacterium]|nr:bifunctional 5,10-methylenetetrahydrofolate dehydrogenase/5,10-methenyltetrahydrofolate cyclohydrolase [Candidatus Roizmanbacteria bacterium]